jgi:hypothetical protein
VLTIDIPGFRNLALEHLVLDFNGVLALDLLLEPKRLISTLRS